MTTPRTPGKSGKGKGRSARTTGRNITTRVRTAKGRKSSSTRWLKRQLNDPYVEEARKLGFRSRSAFKIIELDDRFHFFKPGQRVIDLGAAPGGWTQVAVERVNALGVGKGRTGKIVGIDLQEMEAIAGATLLTHDFMENDAPDLLKEALGGPADIVMSDMAAASTGHTATDHMRIMALLEVALDFARDILAADGVFLCKVLKGGTENELLANMKRDFRSVRHAKPPASRQDSSESYVIAQGYRGTSGSASETEGDETE